MTGHLLVIANQLFVGLILLGCSLALAFATIWTGIVYVIPADRYGKAFGVIVSMYNAAFTLVPLIVGLLRAYHINHNIFIVTPRPTSCLRCFWPCLGSLLSSLPF